MPQIVEEAKRSEDAEIAIEGILAAIKLGLHLENDRDHLLYLCGPQSRLFTYNYREELADALVAGWPDDQVIFEACLKSRLREWQGSKSVDRHVAFEVLIKGYPNSEEVINHLCSLLEDEGSYIDFDHTTNGWSLVKKVYKGNIRVSEALDNFVLKEFDKSYVHERKVSLACQASGSPTALNSLIRLMNIKQSFSFWAISGILDGWGMENEIAAEALLSHIQAADVKYLDSISYLLPRIIKDEEKCLLLLKEVAQQECLSRPDFFIEALGQLSKSNIDDYIDSLLSLTNVNSFKSPLAGLIAHFPEHQKVRELAKIWIGELGSPIATIAMSYSDDEDISIKVLDHTTPLPSVLRKSLILSAEKKINMGLGLFRAISNYSSEINAEVRTLAEGAYYSNLYREGEVDQIHKDNLLNELSMTGENIGSVRQAGFAGMLEANCLDIFTDAKDSYFDGNSSLLDVPVFGQYHHEKNQVIVKKVIANWDEIVGTCGEDIGERLKDRISGKSSLLPWAEIAPNFDESETLKELFLTHCKSTDQKLGAPELNALVRPQPNTQLLLRHCLNSLEGGDSDYDGFATQHTAGIILASQFLENKELLNILVELATKENSGAVIALSQFDSRHQVLNEYCRQIFDDEVPEISYLASSYVICYSGSDAHFLRHIKRRINLGDAGQWCFPYEWIQIVRYRLSQNEECYSSLFDVLKLDTLSPNERASIPQLLAQARGVTPELKVWCEEEIERQDSRFMHEHGYDITADCVQPIFHSLVNLLSDF